MEVNEMSNNSNILLKQESSAKLRDYAARLSNYNEMLDFQNKLESIIYEYQDSQYSVLSTGIFIDKLESFSRWLPELMSNKSKVVPLLVSNMLNGDMFSESIYRGIYNEYGKSDIVLNIYQILDDPTLKLKFSQNGSDGPAEAKINAEQWLVSREAVEVFLENSQGTQVLCIVNELLGINNNFMNCDD
jgi:hypothetical protein